MGEFQICNLTKQFGSEIIGFDPAEAWEDENKNLLRELFNARSVIVFRDIDVDLEWQDRMCRMLIGDDSVGMSEGMKDRRVSNTEEGGLAPNGRLMFHSDLMWHPDPTHIVSLYALEVSPTSASTLVASMIQGWADVPFTLRSQLEGKHARHQSGQVYHRGGDDLTRPIRSEDKSTVKPVHHTHPRTGQSLLYVSEQMTHNIVELPDEESEKLLTDVFKWFYARDRVYEHKWERHDLLLIDNQALQHARPNVKIGDAPRTLRKVSAPTPNVKIERPVYDRS